MRSLLVKLPLPPLALKPGSGGHWSSRAKAVREYREHAYVACLVAMGKERPHYERAEIDYEFFLAPACGLYHPRDDDNARACMKAAQDGFVDARIVASDTARVLKVTSVTLHRTRKEHGGRAQVLALIREVT